MSKSEKSKKSDWETRDEVMPVDECKARTKEKGFGDAEAQRCEQTGSTGTAKGSERKKMHQQEELVKDVHHMDESSELLDEEKPADS